MAGKPRTTAASSVQGRNTRGSADASDHLAGIVVSSLAPSVRKTSDTASEGVLADRDSLYVSHPTWLFMDF